MRNGEKRERREGRRVGGGVRGKGGGKEKERREMETEGREDEV